MCHTLWFVIDSYWECQIILGGIGDFSENSNFFTLEKSLLWGHLHCWSTEFRHTGVIFRICTILFYSREVVTLGTFTLWEYSSDTQGCTVVLQPQGWTRSVHQLNCQSEVSTLCTEYHSNFIKINLNGKTSDIDIIKRMIFASWSRSAW